MCVLDKWYFSTSFSELEVDKAVTARADLDKWYFGTSYSVLEVDKAVTRNIGVCVCPGQMVFQHYIF